MITSHDKQRIGNSAIQALVQQELQRQMADFILEHAEADAAKDAEISRLRGMLEIRENRARKNYAELIEGAERDYYRPELPKVVKVLKSIIWGFIGAVLVGYEKLEAAAAGRYE